MLAAAAFSPRALAIRAVSKLAGHARPGFLGGRFTADGITMETAALPIMKSSTASLHGADISGRSRAAGVALEEPVLRPDRYDELGLGGDGGGRDRDEESRRPDHRLD